MCDCGCLSTQPWWRPYSVACTVTSHGTPAPPRERARRAGDEPVVRVDEVERTLAELGAAPRACPRSCASTQAMNASRSSFGNSGSRTRCTITPWRSSTGRQPPAAAREHVDLERRRARAARRACARAARGRPRRSAGTPRTGSGHAQARAAARTISLAPPWPFRYCSTATPATMTRSRSCWRRATTRSTCSPITTVAGNCPLDLATLNARRVAALAGLEASRSPPARPARCAASSSPRRTSTARPASTATS